MSTPDPTRRMSTKTVAAGAVALGSLGLGTALIYRFMPRELLNVVVGLGRTLAGLRRHSLMVQAHEVVYLAGGQGSPVVLLHGLGADKDSWFLLARHLTRYHRVIIPDLPGFGETGFRPEQRYDVPAQLDRLNAFLDALGMRDFHLMGTSLGGLLGIGYAVRHPEQVRTLTLIAPAGVRAPNPSAVEREILAGGMPLLPKTRADAEKLFDIFMAHPLRIPKRIKETLIQRVLRDAKVQTRVWRDLMAHPTTLEPYLDRVQVPTLLIWGEEDKIIDPSAAEVYISRIPRVHLVLLPDCGHVSIIEKPAAVAGHFLQFAAIAERLQRAQTRLEHTPSAAAERTDATDWRAGAKRLPHL